MLVYRSVNVPTKEHIKKEFPICQVFGIHAQKTESVGLNPEVISIVKFQWEETKIQNVDLLVSVVGTIESSISHVPKGCVKHGEFSWDRIRKTITKKTNKSKIFGSVWPHKSMIIHHLGGHDHLKTNPSKPSKTTEAQKPRRCSHELLGGQVPTYKGRIIPTIQDFSLQIKGVGWDSCRPKSVMSSCWWRIESWVGGVCLLHSKKITTTP